MPRLSSDRRQSVDLLRIVAAFGIVWAHMDAPYPAEGYVALALFVILTAFLSFRSASTRAPGRFLRGRAWRVLVPWLIWCAIYLVVEALRLRDLSRLWTLTDPRWLLIGPVIHLWFLPFVLVSAPLVVAAERGLRGARAVWAAAVLAAPIGVAAIWLHDHDALAPPFVQWAFAAMPMLYGLLSAAAQGRGGWPAPLVFALLATMPPALLWHSFLAPHLLAAALVFEALWRAPIRHPWLPSLGALAFGIYLVHPFFMLVWFHFTGGLPLWLGAMAVFVMSALAAAAMRALPIRLRAR